jgi:opacity protein-like surface antigen
MRQVSILLLFCFAVCASVFAQEYPRAEVFGGYSYLHMDTQGVTGSSLDQLCNTVTVGNCPLRFQVHPGFNGWEAAGQFNLNSWFGLKADFSGHYGTLVTAQLTSASVSRIRSLNFSTPRQSKYDFLFGPVASYRKHGYTPFVHGLFGDEHVSFGNFQIPSGIPIPTPLPSIQSHDYFAFVLGGGVDIRVAKHVLVRAGEFDYQFVKQSGNSGSHQNDFRISTGVVFTSGRK